MLQFVTDRFLGATPSIRHSRGQDDFTFILVRTLVSAPQRDVRVANTFIADFLRLLPLRTFDTFKSGPPDIYRIGSRRVTSKRPTGSNAPYSLYASDQAPRNGVTRTLA